jgi:hypothetical protein
MSTQKKSGIVTRQSYSDALNIHNAMDDAHILAEGLSSEHALIVSAIRDLCAT